MRYALVSRSTDMRCPATSVRFTESKRCALVWRASGGEFTHADPDAARNHHHTLRTAYVVPTGWRKPPSQALARSATAMSSGDYPRTLADALLASLGRMEELT